MKKDKRERERKREKEIEGGEKGGRKTRSGTEEGGWGVKDIGLENKCSRGLQEGE